MQAVFYVSGRSAATYVLDEQSGRIDADLVVHNVGRSRGALEEHTLALAGSPQVVRVQASHSLFSLALCLGDHLEKSARRVLVTLQYRT